MDDEFPSLVDLLYSLRNGKSKLQCLTCTCIFLDCHSVLLVQSLEAHTGPGRERKNLSRIVGSWEAVQVCELELSHAELLTLVMWMATLSPLGASWPADAQKRTIVAF